MAAPRPLAQSLMIGRSRTCRQTLAETIEATRMFGPSLHARDSREARQLLANNPVDMIFFDAGGIGHDFDWLHLHSRSEWRDIPVLIFLHEKNETARIAALESGAADCLPYSTSALELAARIRRHLETKERIDQLRRAKNDMEQLAITDPLTGLCNRGFFNHTLESETARGHRARKPFSLMMIDIDHFKSINDTYGHQTGDALLQKVAGVLQASIRKSDIACRYGGEEFALILPGTKAVNARYVADRIHRKMAAACNERSFPGAPVTVSIGISCSAETSWINPSRIVGEADQALYAAKNLGRNRTETFKRPAPFPPEDLPSPFFSPFAHPA